MSEEIRLASESLSTGFSPRGAIDATGDYFHGDVVEEVPFPGQGPGLEGLKETLSRIRHAFPDSKNGASKNKSRREKVLTRFIWSGTHQGVLRYSRYQPFGPGGMVIDRFEQGKVKSTRILLDTLTMMQQLGVVP